MRAMQQRVREVLARALVRSWEYRQRNLARGIWAKLRRLLADAEHAYVISDESLEKLLASGGAHVEPVGLRLDPPKKLLFVTAHQLALLPDYREIPVNLGADFLAARNVALVAFASVTRAIGHEG
jgi:hypothetical protein